MKKLSILILLTISITFLGAQIPGTLDQAFGDTGIVLLDDNFDSQNNVISSVAIQNNGRLVFGGYSWGEEPSGYNFRHSRLWNLSLPGH